MNKWAIITGEYPPQPGGVSDYTHILAQRLAAAGDEVHIWAPGCLSPTAEPQGVSVHRLAEGFGLLGLVKMGRELDALSSPYRILVQYVPHAFGWKAMNLAFCLWLARRRVPVWVMFHEVVFPLRWLQPIHHYVLGIVTRFMAAVVIRSSEKIFVSTPAWEALIRQFSFGSKSALWLPVPSTIGENVDLNLVQIAHASIAPGQGSVIGHFGTYAPDLCDMLREIIPGVLYKDENRRFVLLGRGSRMFSEAVIKNEPGLRDRILAFDDMAAGQIGLHLAACDLVLQPYPDGITSRRTSSMASLALGVAIVTNLGVLSESLWRESGAVALAAGYSPTAFIEVTERMLLCPDMAAGLRSRAALLYADKFSVQRTFETIRDCA